MINELFKIDINDSLQIKINNQICCFTPVHNKSYGKHCYPVINFCNNNVYYSDRWIVSEKEFLYLVEQNRIFWDRRTGFPYIKEE